MSESKDGARAPRAVIEQAPAGKAGRKDAAAEVPADAATADGAARAKQDRDRFQDATWGFIEGIGHAAWAYADAHPHTVLYGAIGLVLAVLILVVGLWHTIVLAIFTGIGAAIGRMRDGEGTAFDFFTKLFGGKR